MNHAKNKKVYATFDFDNFSEQGLKAFVRALKQRDQKVVTLNASNRKTKKDGLFTKKAVLFFDNSQRAEIVIGDLGDIVSLKLNGKATPFGQPKTDKEFAKNLASLLKRGQEAFDQSLAKKLKAVKVDTAIKPAARTNKAKLAQVNDAFEEANANLRIAMNNLERANADLNESNQLLEQKEQSLVNEKDLSKTLRSEITRLEGAA